MKTPTAQELDTCETLANSMKELDIFNEERHTQILILRFLRARRGDYDKTLEMLSNHETWRKTMNLDDPVTGLLATFVFEEQDKVLELFPRFLHKTDRRGRPLFIQKFGGFNFKELQAVTNQDRYLRSQICDLEKFSRYMLPAVSIARQSQLKKSGSKGIVVDRASSDTKDTDKDETHGGRGKELDGGEADEDEIVNVEENNDVGEEDDGQVKQMIVIVDLSGADWGLFLSFRSFMEPMLPMGSNNYPELVRRIYIINAGPIFLGAFWGLSKIYDKNIVDKVVMLGTEWQDRLEADIGLDAIPEEIGGNCTSCEGGNCRMGSKVGPWNDGSLSEHGYPIKFWEELKKVKTNT